MEIVPLGKKNISAIWEINQQGLPGTGEVTPKEVEGLLEFSSFAVGIFDLEELLGFVICMPPGTQYASLNYSWFNERYDSFVYVDRIAVREQHRNKNIGTLLYDFVVEAGMNVNAPIAAEVSLKPPNPGSMRFHSRFNFEEVGILHHNSKSVTMLLRPAHS